MRIKPWNLYRTRDKKDCVLITAKGEPLYRGAMEGWKGFCYSQITQRLCESRWGIYGQANSYGFACEADLTEHVISVRDLVTRKLNPPPIEWFLAAYQRRLLEDFAA